MAIDVSWIAQGIPLYALALLIAVSFGILAKVKLFDGWGINIIIAIMFGVIFLSFSSVRDFVVNVTAGFTALMLFVFLFMLVIVFVVKEPGAYLKPVTIAFMILMVFIIIISFFAAFPSTQAYLPGQPEADGNVTLLSLKHFILEDEVLSGILLVITVFVVGYLITRK